MMSFNPLGDIVNQSTHLKAEIENFILHYEVNADPQWIGYKIMTPSPFKLNNMKICSTIYKTKRHKLHKFLTEIWRQPGTLQVLGLRCILLSASIVFI